MTPKSINKRKPTKISKLSINNTELKIIKKKSIKYHIKNVLFINKKIIENIKISVCKKNRSLNINKNYFIKE